MDALISMGGYLFGSCWSFSSFVVLIEALHDWACVTLCVSFG